MSWPIVPPRELRRDYEVVNGRAFHVGISAAGHLREQRRWDGEHLGTGLERCRDHPQERGRHEQPTRDQEADEDALADRPDPAAEPERPLLFRRDGSSGAHW
jgi:hypothetical protein